MAVTLIAFIAILLPSSDEAYPVDPAIDQLTAPSPHDLSLASDPLPKDASAAQASSHTEAPKPVEAWVTLPVKSGEALAAIFQKAGYSANDLHTLAHSSKQAQQTLADIKPGQAVAFLADNNKQLEKVRLVKTPLETIEFRRTTSGYTSETIQRKPDIAYNFARVTIESSLFQSVNKVGLPDSLALQLVDIFGWDVDFVLDIHNGDSFDFVYEEQILDGQKIGDGDIVAANFNRKSGALQAVRYTDKDGNKRYYSPGGVSMKKEFLRTPVDFARISSPFSANRMHPILHTMRAHKGTDYAAPMGTPVKATANGKVSYAGIKNGYGNTIVLQHGQTYETVYAHLSKYARGIKDGARVTQGQVIGYVGMTGLATGPHLHYEFHVNGEVRNPATAKLASASPLPASEKPRFLAQTRLYLTQLASYTHKLKATQVALAE
jgi:murein DD-endopeptidase MepM/ murein hydrolase activator NlpD